MEVNKVFDVRCVCDNNIFNTLLQFEPKSGAKFMSVNECGAVVDYEIINAKPIITIGNPNNKQEVIYYLCVVREVDNEKIGVKQFKFIMGNSYQEMEDNLNKFLYENRHKCTIEDIAHGVGYIAIQYRMRNIQDIRKSMCCEEGYRKVK